MGEQGCVATVPGCPTCAERPWRARGEAHTCDDLCRFSGEQMRADEELHQIMHRPVTCHRCDAVLNDRRGNDFTLAELCPERTCRRYLCPGCGDLYGSDGPVGCPECSPVGWLGLIAAWLTRPLRRRRQQADRRQTPGDTT